MRSPSSLIFLVLLGVWAAYFVQYWVRRRDHLATARSVEQFSKAMRVLERREALPRTDLSEPAPRSYAVHPARANRPQVLVKRAVASDPSGPLTVTARVDDLDQGVGSARPAAPGRSAEPARPAASRPAASPPAASGPVPASPPAPGQRRAPVASVRPRMRPSRRVRGLLVLASLVELLFIVPLVVLAMLPVWALAPAIGAVVATFAYLRSGVRSEQAMLRAHRRRLAALARLRSTAPVTAAAGSATASAPARTAASADGPAATASDVVTTADTEVLVTVSATGAGATEDESADAGAAALEVGAGERASSVEAPAEAPAGDSVVDPLPAAAVMVPILDEDDMPLTWDPVPVPRPTYTMKARAERPEVAPAAVTADPVSAVHDREADDEAYDQRRVAGA